MQRPVFTVLLGVMALGVVSWNVMAWQRASQVVVESEPTDEMVLICTETGRVLRTEWQPTPAINDHTGQATLVEALYCPECRAWHAAPPPEVMEQQRSGPQCPKTGARLALEGPIP